MINKILLTSTIIFVSVVFNFAKGQDKIFPIPTGNIKQMFYLQRTSNTNTIVCELNLNKGKVDRDDPIHVFWIRYSDKGQVEELNYIQKKFAYGIVSKEIGINKYELTFVSYKKYKMYLMMAADNQCHVYTLVNNKQVILSKIFIKINGGSFWLPNIEYVELTGVDPSTNLPIKQRLKI